MNQKPTPEGLGEPALKVAGFQLWVHGRQFPDADDYDDGNWLRVTVSLEADKRLGHIRARVDITPDHLTQSHRMEFDIDQSYLPGITAQCSALLQHYPIRGGEGPPEGGR